MAGVAGPMLRNSRGAGARLLAGLLIGEIAAGALLAVPAFLLGEGLRAVLGLQARLWALAALCVFFGVADLANRTPHVWRQVPEDLINRLPPGPLGLAWGFDLGLLFTTQKAVSLIWVAIAAGILLDPPLAAALIVGIAVAASMAVVAYSLWWRPGARGPSAWALRARQVRYGSGVAILILFGLTAVQAWHA
jgi:Na+/phosphate symporter